MEINNLFLNFQKQKKQIENLNEPILVKFIEIFVDTKIINENKLIIYKIIGKCEYPIFNSIQHSKISIINKNVVKHFNEIKLSEFYWKNISFVQKCEFLAIKPLISSSIIFYTQKKYVFYTPSFEKIKQNENEELIF